MSNLTRYEEGATLSPDLLRKDPLGFFFSDTAHATTIQAKAQFIRELINSLDEMEHQAEDILNKEKIYAITSTVSALASLSLSSFLFPPLGLAITGASMVAAAGAGWQAVVNHKRYDPISLFSKRYKLSLETAEPIQWALLWHYAGGALFNDALYTASKGIVAEGRLVSRDNRPPLIKAVNYVADCQGIPFERVDASIKLLKVQVFSNDGTALPPTQIQQPVLPTYQQPHLPTYQQPVEAPVTEIQQPQVYIQPAAAQYEIAAEQVVDIVELVLSSVNSLAFIGGQRCGKSRLMAIASRHGLKIGKFKGVSLISALSKPGEDDHYWQHCVNQTYCDMGARVMDITSNREQTYVGFLKTIRAFKQSANSENPQLLIIDEFSHLSERLTKDIKDKVEIAKVLMDEITNVISVVSSGGAKRGWYVWLGTPKGAIGSMGEAGCYMKSLSLVFCAIKPDEKVDSSGVIVEWDDTLYVATKRNFPALRKPETLESVDLDNRIVFIGSKWHNQTSYQLEPVTPQPVAVGATSVPTTIQSGNTEFQAAPTSNAGQSQSDKAIAKLEASPYSTLWEFIKYELGTWDNEKIKVVAAALAELICDRDLQHLKDKFHINSIYDARYSYPGYRQKVAAAHRATNNICCCCFEKPSEEAHHSDYQGEEDREGINLFPVCGGKGKGGCHDQLCHSPENWEKDASNPIWGNKNTIAWREKLKAGYQLLNQRGSLGI